MSEKSNNKNMIYLMLHSVSTCNVCMCQSDWIGERYFFPFIWQTGKSGHLILNVSDYRLITDNC